MFRLLRHFAVLSLGAITVAAVALMLSWSRIESRLLHDFAETNNVALARSLAKALPAVQSEAFLERSRPLADADLPRHPDLPALAARIADHVQGLPVVKIKLYDLDGRTVYSSQPSQIGERKGDNPSFLVARAGRVASAVERRERFSAFDGERVDLDLISSHVPLRAAPDATIGAVLEIYSDISPLVAAAATIERIAAGVILGVLALLYGTLFFFVRHAEAALRAKEAQRMQALDALRDSHAELRREVSDRERTEARMQHLAQHDALTGLPNRMLLLQRAQAAITRSAYRGERLGLLSIDVDRFKTVNDSLGHRSGDLLLKAVAARLQAVRPEATIARLGSDEFAVLLEQAGDARSASDEAAAFVRALEAPIDLAGERVRVAASAGVALFPADGRDAETLLRHAGMALVHAKEHHRGGVQAFSPAMGAIAEARLSVTSELRAALEQHELVLHYQPQVALASGAPCGVEALVRWQHPQRGLLGPERFLPIAEESGLVVPLGEWVLERACAQLREWIDAGLGVQRVAVNLSAQQLAQPGLADVVSATLSRHRLPAGSLELELTETVVVADRERAAATLERLRERGVRIAIDDFGTGYSSLAYLKSLPVDCIKIDRAFVAKVAQEDGDAVIARTMVRLGRSLGLRVLAEGIEHDAQRAFFSAAGCHEGQGWAFAPAMPAQTLAQWWAGRSTPAARARSTPSARALAPAA